MLKKLEALLFLYGEPITLEKTANLLSEPISHVEEAAQTLQEKLEKDPDAGLSMIIDNGKLQLVTKKELAPVLEKIVDSGTKEELTPAALETLSIIAYSGPVSKAEIEQIRGVNSTFILRNLIMNGLIEKQEKGVYCISLNMLNKLGLKTTGELPEYEQFKDLKNRVQS